MKQDIDKRLAQLEAKALPDSSRITLIQIVNPLTGEVEAEINVLTPGPKQGGCPAVILPAKNEAKHR